jgi:hypothetical protein
MPQENITAIRGVESKPYPSLEGLRNLQRMMRVHNPKVRSIRVEEYGR